MAKFEIEAEECLCTTHCEGIEIEGKSCVELSDEEIAQIIELINSKQTLDVEKMGLKECFPAIFEKLNEACYHAAYNGEEYYQLWKGYYDGFDYNPEQLMDYCMNECGFAFDFDEEAFEDETGRLNEEDVAEAELDMFQEWLDDYVLDLTNEEAKAFFYDHMNASVDMSDLAYKVSIPKVITEKSMIATETNE